MRWPGDLRRACRGPGGGSCLLPWTRRKGFLRWNLSWASPDGRHPWSDHRRAVSGYPGWEYRRSIRLRSGFRGRCPRSVSCGQRRPWWSCIPDRRAVGLWWRSQTSFPDRRALVQRLYRRLREVRQRDPRTPQHSRCWLQGSGCRLRGGYSPFPFLPVCLSP